MKKKIITLASIALSGLASAQTANWASLLNNTQLKDDNGNIGTYSVSGGGPAPTFTNYAFTGPNAQGYTTATTALNVNPSMDYVGVGDQDSSDKDNSYKFSLKFTAPIPAGTIIFLESLNQETLELTSDGAFSLSAYGTVVLNSSLANSSNTTAITSISNGLKFVGNSTSSVYGHFLKVDSAISGFEGFVSNTGSLGATTDNLYLNFATPVPEPSSTALLGLGALGLLARRKR